MLWLRNREAAFLHKMVMIWCCYVGRLKAYIVLKILSLYCNLNILTIHWFICLHEWYTLLQTLPCITTWEQEAFDNYRERKMFVGLVFYRFNSVSMESMVCLSSKLWFSYILSWFFSYLFILAFIKSYSLSVWYYGNWTLACTKSSPSEAMIMWISSDQNTCDKITSKVLKNYLVSRVSTQFLVYAGKTVFYFFQ